MKSGGKKVITCNDINSADLRTHCETAFENCTALDGDDEQASCAYQAGACVDMYLRGATSYPLKTPVGTALTYSTPVSCFSSAVRLTNNFGPLKDLPKKTCGMLGKEGLKDSDANKLDQDRINGKKAHTCEDIGTAGLKTQCETVFEACKTLNGDDEQASCAYQAGACRDMYLNGASTYPLKTPRGVPIIYGTPASCFSSAMRLTKDLGPFKVYPLYAQGPFEPEAGKSGSAEGAVCVGDFIFPGHLFRLASYLTEKSDPWSADERTRFEISFDQAGFLPETGYGKKFTSAILANWNGDSRGLLVMNVKYWLEEIGDGRYKLIYRITDKLDRDLSSEMTIEFATKDAVITDYLVFAVTLRKESDFETPVAARIIRK